MPEQAAPTRRAAGALAASLVLAVGISWAGAGPTARFDIRQPDGRPATTARKQGPMVVRFDTQPTTLTFGLPASVLMTTPGGVRYWNGYAETFDKANCEGCCEVIQDRESRYSRMWVAQRSPARIVVRWRAAMNDAKYRIAHTDVPSGSPYGRGDWVDEWYTITPDGTHVRTCTIHTGLAPRAGASWGRKGLHPFECQETIVLGPKGHQPVDDIHVGAVTLIRMDGKARTISWKTYPKNADLFSGANIQVVNLKGRYRPFTIVPPADCEIRPYYGPSTRRSSWPGLAWRGSPAATRRP